MKTKRKCEKQFNRGIEAIELGQYKKAKKWFKIARFYNFPVGLVDFQLGIIALEELNLSEAVRQFHSYLSSSSINIENNQLSYYYLGIAYNILGNQREALDYLKKALGETANIHIQCKALLSIAKIKSYSPEMLSYLIQERFNYLLNIENSFSYEQKRTTALIEALRGNYDKCISILQEIIEEKPKLREVYKELGECYFLSQNYEDAIPVLKQGRKIAPDDQTISLLLAKAYYNTNRLPEAKTELLTLVKVIPNNAKFHYHLANVFYKLKQFNKAIRYYSKSVDSDPNFHLSYYNLGVLYQKTGLLDISQDYYFNAKEINNNFYQVHYNLGLLHYQQKNYFEALNAFLEANQLNENDKRAWHNFNTLKSIKLIAPDSKVDEKVISIVNIYLLIIAIILLLLYLYFQQGA